MKDYDGKVMRVVFQQEQLHTVYTESQCKHPQTRRDFTLVVTVSVQIHCAGIQSQNNKNVSLSKYFRTKLCDCNTQSVQCCVSDMFRSLKRS